DGADRDLPRPDEGRCEDGGDNRLPEWIVMRHARLLAACVVAASVTPAAAQAPAGRIPLGTGATIVQTLSTDDADRESMHQVRLASDSGLHYEWRLEEVHDNGDTLRQQFRYLEGWSDLADSR